MSLGLFHLLPRSVAVSSASVIRPITRTCDVTSFLRSFDRFLRGAGDEVEVFADALVGLRVRCIEVGSLLRIGDGDGWPTLTVDGRPRKLGEPAAPHFFIGSTRVRLAKVAEGLPLANGAKGHELRCLRVSVDVEETGGDPHPKSLC